jgi:hypothetical protein
MLFGLTGKMYLNGVYATDITIPGDELSINQLVFYFTAETPKERPFRSITLKVTLPGNDPTLLPVPILSPAVVNPDRPKMVLRAPLLAQQLILRPGKIETIVVTEKEELDAGGFWITSVPKLN